ncbi:iron-siderophore ABC transporter substrate-binding protein [Lentzea sp. CA-135723]|uniref:iron-siderophore ABC transporter substrate-binding protein n=1 Tax=Lentzea sp. CA-135723 TaxID=3239950 RepID=UPI003D90EBD9
MRIFRSLLAAALAALALTACSTTPEAPTTGSSGGEGQFPVTIKTAFGDVTVPKQPQRVVALGWSDAETALALGVQPVGAADWLAVGKDGLGPWVTEKYTTAPKMLGTQEIDLEALAALSPDLILDTKASGKEERQEQLAKLGVPVVGIPTGAEAYLTSWRDQLDMIGKAVGKTERAAQLKADLEGKFKEAAEDHPKFKGASVVVGVRNADAYAAYIKGAGRVDFMTELGFTNSPAIEALKTTGFSVKVSAEQLTLLDANLTVMQAIGDTAAVVKADPLFQAVPSVKAGRSVLLEDRQVSQAFSSNSVPGLAWALDKTVPLFAAALDR